MLADITSEQWPASDWNQWPTSSEYTLYRQIGQLKVENDFLARRLGKEAGPSVVR